jgi:hypothetical protein
MELYLHVGTNKTASSYTQSLLTINKTGLQKQKFYVPDSKWDQQMVDGIISPGNGHQLAKYLCEKDPSIHLLKYFGDLINQSQSKSCNRVVLSNEILIRLFSDPYVLSQFQQSALKAGFASINILCVLRNPYQHALSLYKHRMKGGNFLDTQDWLETNYETMRLFKVFLTHFKDYNNVQWKFKAYRRDSNYLSKIFFKEFLNTDIELLQPKQRQINPSMPLKGLRLISMLKKIDRVFPKALYTAFLNKDFKINESELLVRRFFLKYDEFLKSKFIKTYHDLSLLLENEEKRAEFNKQPDLSVTGQDDEYSLEQVEQVVAILKSKSRHDLFKSSIKTLKRLKVKLYTKSNKFDSEKFGGNLRT